MSPDLPRENSPTKATVTFVAAHLLPRRSRRALHPGIQQIVRAHPLPQLRQLVRKHAPPGAMLIKALLNEGPTLSLASMRTMRAPTGAGRCIIAHCAPWPQAVGDAFK